MAAQHPQQQQQQQQVPWASQQHTGAHPAAMLELLLWALVHSVGAWVVCGGCLAVVGRLLGQARSYLHGGVLLAGVC
jgi:Na+/H+-dicarboxylate symporter